MSQGRSNHHTRFPTRRSGSPLLPHSTIISHQSPTEVVVDDHPRKSGKERETETETGTERDRERDKDRDRQIQRDRATERHRKTQRHRDRDRERERTRKL